ncbi:MAG: hypothetical protein ABEI74_02765 [Candidatus Pacearchaeota archaeon]
MGNKKKSNKSVPGKNEFFDISSLRGWGIIWFPVSMSKISTKQSVSNFVDWLKFFGDRKVNDAQVGLNFTYCDYIYFNSSVSARNMKDKSLFQMISHKNGLKKKIRKNRKDFQIQHAFHFETWGNLTLELEDDFNSLFNKIKSFYNKDSLFRKYIKEDAKYLGRKLNGNQLNFFLEEHLVVYLVLNKKVRFRNEYVQGRENWILLAHPGVPLKAQVYLFQKNPLGFKTDNPYIGQYNLDGKKFYDYYNFDLDSWNYD